MSNNTEMFREVKRHQVSGSLGPDIRHTVSVVNFRTRRMGSVWSWTAISELSHGHLPCRPKGVPSPKVLAVRA